MTNMSDNHKEKEIELKILKAFHGDENHLRTVKGVAEDAGLSVEEVESYIVRHRDLFKESSLVPSGTYKLKLRMPIAASVEL